MCKYFSIYYLNCMFYCHLLVIYKTQQTNLIIFKHNKNSKILQKHKKNLILKNIFQYNTSMFELFNVFIISSLSTGSYSLKKKTFLNVLLEVTYTLNLEKYSRQYYSGKFYLKSASLVVVNIEFFLRENFYDSKIAEISYITDSVNSNLCKKKNKIQFFPKSIGVVNYSFNSSKSKMSTSFFDEILITSLNLTKKNFYYLDILNWNKASKNSVFSELFSLKLIDFYIFHIRNLKSITSIKNLANLSFSIVTNKMIKIFTFFLGFFAKKIFFLSTEITFYRKVYCLNPIKYIIDKYIQLARENVKIYSNNTYNFSMVWFDKFFLNQTKRYFIFVKNINFLKNNFDFQHAKIIFQKKFVERIAEKIWNLKFRFSEYNFDIYFKKFKKLKKNYREKEFYSKWVSSIIIYLQNNFFFNKLCLSIQNATFVYKLFNRMIYLKLYYTIKRWSNLEIDSIMFLSSKMKTSNIKSKKLLTKFHEIILKKYVKYKCNF
nr:hypothetical protein CcurKRNrm1_p036 [Cryptomonas curvata]